MSIVWLKCTQRPYHCGSLIVNWDLPPWHQRSSHLSLVTAGKGTQMCRLLSCLVFIQSGPWAVQRMWYCPIWTPHPTMVRSLCAVQSQYWHKKQTRCYLSYWSEHTNHCGVWKNIALCKPHDQIYITTHGKA